jgi:hypothetical protein
MGIIKKDFKFKVIKNFLTETEVDFFKRYTIMFHQNNTKDFDFKQNLNGDTSKYSDYAMEALMIGKKNLVEKEAGIEVYPTYSFWRCYTKFADLKEHRDRPSCEISVTCQIASCGTEWPIYIEDTPILLDNGDAVMYWGTDVNHSRKEFIGDYHIQTFLHYVDANGPYKEFKKDKRINYGVGK